MTGDVPPGIAQDSAVSSTWTLLAAATPAAPAASASDDASARILRAAMGHSRTLVEPRSQPKTAGRSAAGRRKSSDQKKFTLITSSAVVGSLLALAVVWTIWPRPAVLIVRWPQAERAELMKKAGITDAEAQQLQQMMQQFQQGGGPGGPGGGGFGGGPGGPGGGPGGGGQ